MATTKEKVSIIVRHVPHEVRKILKGKANDTDVHFNDVLVEVLEKAATEYKTKKGEKP